MVRSQAAAALRRRACAVLGAQQPPESVNAPLPPLLLLPAGQLAFVPGQERRLFVAVPVGATWAELRLKAGSVETPKARRGGRATGSAGCQPATLLAAPRRCSSLGAAPLALPAALTAVRRRLLRPQGFMVRATQLLPHTRYSDSEHRSYVQLSEHQVGDARAPPAAPTRCRGRAPAGGCSWWDAGRSPGCRALPPQEHVAAFPVAGGATLELTLAQFWSRCVRRGAARPVSGPCGSIVSAKTPAFFRRCSLGTGVLDVELAFHGLELSPAKARARARAVLAGWWARATCIKGFTARPLALLPAPAPLQTLVLDGAAGNRKVYAHAPLRRERFKPQAKLEVVQIPLRPTSERARRPAAYCLARGGLACVAPAQCALRGQQRNAARLAHRRRRRAGAAGRAARHAARRPHDTQAHPHLPAQPQRGRQGHPHAAHAQPLRLRRRAGGSDVHGLRLQQAAAVGCARRPAAAAPRQHALAGVGGLGSGARHFRRVIRLTPDCPARPQWETSTQRASSSGRATTPSACSCATTARGCWRSSRWAGLVGWPGARACASNAHRAPRRRLPSTVTWLPALRPACRAGSAPQGLPMVVERKLESAVAVPVYSSAADSVKATDAMSKERALCPGEGQRHARAACLCPSEKQGSGSGRGC